MYKEHWEPLDQRNGDLMSMTQFIAGVECGGFTDYDGFGLYSNGVDMLYGRKLDLNDIDTTFSHVIWYNK